MALLFVDSFDHYATADLLKKWDVSGFASIASGQGRRGSSALSIAGPTIWMQKNFSGYKTTLVLGAAFKVTSFGSGANVLFAFCNGGTIGVTIAVQSDGRVQAYRGNTGGTLLGQSSPGVVSGGITFFLEAKVVWNDTTGAVQIKVNGVSVITLTNVDTNNGAADAFSNFIVGATNFGFTGYVDDLYVLDNSGSANTDFLGDVRVDAYFPTSEGAVQQWAPSTGTVHYALVDETAPSSSDYVSSATAGQVEVFGITDMTNTPLAVFGVQLNAAALKDDAGARSVNGVARISGTNYESASIPLNESLRYALALWDQNPATAAAWTKTAVNAAEFGVKTV